MFKKVNIIYETLVPIILMSILSTAGGNVRDNTIIVDITPADVRIVPVAQLNEVVYPIKENNSITTDWNYKNLNAEKKCLAENIYFEARGQSLKGQLAVALVTINRVKSSLYPNSICEVVWQKTRMPNGKDVAQFSWTIDNIPNVPKDENSWNRIKRLSDSIINNGSLYTLYDFTHGSLYYHATDIHPWWGFYLKQTAIIGDHVFYQKPSVATHK